jgi:hypothetical protein
MPTTKEFSVRMNDQPGTLGKFCRALADRDVNILANGNLNFARGKRGFARRWNLALQL